MKIKYAKKKSDENKCEEVVETDIQKICKSSTTATKDEECAVLKINDNDGTKKCVKDTTEGASTSCKEEIMECEEKTDGATEAICGKLKVKLEDEQKCQVTEDQKCELVDYCEYATLEDGDDCANYPVKNNNNKEILVLIKLPALLLCLATSWHSFSSSFFLHSLLLFFTG